MPTFLSFIMYIYYLFILEANSELKAQMKESEIVSTKFGNVRGYVHSSTKKKEFVSFKRIPFAKPPVDILRFQDPQPPEPWDDILDGSSDPPACAQLSTQIFIDGNTTLAGEEDCLYLNVFTPRTKDSGLAVMVYFHGGGYIHGDAASFKPHEMLSEEIVLVAAQYRLGVLGFISTEDSVLEGNYGMKDQIQALEWVNQNIEAFGGDPNKVTIFGTSAGGGSVHFHIFSKKSTPLFSRAILESGNLLCPWAKARRPREEALIIGNHFDCFKNGSVTSEGEVGSLQLLECLRNIPVDLLAPSVDIFYAFTIFPLLAGPSVDGKLLSDEPEILLRKNDHKHLNMIVGNTKNEGGILTCLLEKFPNQRDAIISDFERIGPISLGLQKEDNATQMSKEAYNHFIGGIKNDDNSLESLTKMFGDRQFAVCSDWTAFFHSKNSKSYGNKVYNYEDVHRGQFSVIDHCKLKISKKWVSHVDELIYLTPVNEENDFIRNEEDSKMRDITIKLWTNFAKFGDPTPDESLGFKWDPFTPESKDHLLLQPKPRMAKDNRENVRRFWKSLPTAQNKMLFGPLNH